MAITVSSDGRNTIVQLGEGTFDSEAASRLRSVLSALVAESREPVIVDASRAREVTPIALACLVDDFEMLRSVRFRGLSQHASRLFAHLTKAR